MSSQETANTQQSDQMSPIEIAKNVSKVIEIMNSNAANFARHGVTWEKTDVSVVAKIQDQPLLSIHLGTVKKRVHNVIAKDLGKACDYEFDTYDDAIVKFFQEMSVALQDYFDNRDRYSVHILM